MHRLRAEVDERLEVERGLLAGVRRPGRGVAEAETGARVVLERRRALRRRLGVSAAAAGARDCDQRRDRGERQEAPRSQAGFHASFSVAAHGRFRPA